MKARHVLAAAACAALCLPAAAQQLKPGLWEVTNKISGNPQMEQAIAQMQQQMASMPPAQRKQMEETMARQGVQMGGGAAGVAVRVCMTKEMVDQNPVPVQQQGDCKTTTQQRTGNTYKTAFTCANPASSGEGEYTFMGPEAYKGKMTVQSSPRGKPETMTMEGSGKWIGADCGSVKPFPTAKK